MRSEPLVGGPLSELHPGTRSADDGPHYQGDDGTVIDLRTLIDEALTIAEQAQGKALADAIVTNVKKIEDPAEQAVTAQIFTDVAAGLKA